VLREYESLLEAKQTGRGLPPGDNVIEALSKDVEDMVGEPFEWAHRC
jgi:hypothetical protein